MYRVLVFTAFVLVQSVSQMPEQMLGMRFLLQNKEESVCKQTVFKVQPNNKLALRMWLVQDRAPAFFSWPTWDVPNNTCHER